ncbi:MAG: NAD(P)/FAD-dependent oxidoreductase [Gammaproteobacteria bacterium]|nr:NAD(P)/FAD-dependent oxidoreductase [Gammaproteobacteria bacterium]MBU1444111.1 NAD(P)/FAD-dependent oxidoreductase [Gammaproteobacteria bacterium]MBU2287569.1 NAD(P)/FAD-dependent oxidoreductase [Gammaproteobacteria bacterium]
MDVSRSSRFGSIASTRPIHSSCSSRHAPHPSPPPRVSIARFTRPSAARQRRRRMKVDLLVIGASFAGLACARAAALAGLSVAVVEKKARAGAKLHTTGIIVRDAVDSVPWLAEVPPTLVRRIEGVRLYAPNMRHVDLHSPGYYFWATDTPALLDWMSDSAQASGVALHPGTLFEHAVLVQGRWQVPLGDGHVLRASYLVGADGPHSRVAKVLGLSRNEHFLFGVEHEYRGARMASNFLHCFVDRRLARGYIGWALDGVGVGQVGLARRLNPHLDSVDRAALRLDPLLDKISQVVGTGDAPPVAVRAGMIPCGGVLASVGRERALLVGDAAGMVSPVTAGGIHYALQHGARAGEAIAAFIRGEADDPSRWFVRSYPGFRLKRALRWSFDRFQSDWVFDRLLSTAALRRAAQWVYFQRKAGPLPEG